MKLTSENKAHIDALSYFGLLSRWRNARIGDPWFQDETGDYWTERMRLKRIEDPEAAIVASKDIGWSK